MATTQIAPTETATPIPQIVTHEVPRPQRGWISWLTTTDHKRLGIMYLVGSWIFFMVGGVEALMMRLQLAQADNTLITPQTYNALVTLHGTTMVFLFLMPMIAGFGELPRAADDRRARHGLPAPERPVVLAVRRGRRGLLRVDPLEPARVRLDLLRTAVGEGVLTDRGRRRVDLHGPPARRRLVRRRAELLRHDRQHARSRHGLGPAPAVLLGDADAVDPADHQPPGDRRPRSRCC